jgi:hypothetical protein
MLGGYDYCTAHFILACYKLLEKPPEKTLGHETESIVKTRGEMLEEIVDKVTSLSLETENLTNRERGPLMDILLWACDSLDRTSHRGSGSGF